MVQRRDNLWVMKEGGRGSEMEGGEGVVVVTCESHSVAHLLKHSDKMFNGSYSLLDLCEGGGG